MRRLNQLWRTLELVPGLCDVSAYWEHHLGEEYSFIRPYLRTRDECGARYPCPRPHDADCPRKIVDYGDGSFAAICRHPHKLCEEVPLSIRDVLVQELDMGTFIAPVAQALGVRCRRPTLRFAGLWDIGVSARTNSRGQATFLQIERRQDAVVEGVRRLLTESSGPFLLLAPTDRFRSAAVQQLLEARGICFVSLEDQIRVDDTGRFYALDPVAQDDDHPVTPPADRERMLNAFCQKYDIPKTRAADEAEVDPTDLYKWVRDELPKKSKKSARIEALLRRGILKPTR